MEFKMKKLSELFASQILFYDLDVPFKNEFETIKLLHCIPRQQSVFIDCNSHDFLDNLLIDIPKTVLSNNSYMYRAIGNKYYQKPDGVENGIYTTKAQNLFRSSFFYSMAIRQAENAYDALSLAYANRGLALYENGYYAEAYDDCLSALEFGYPKNLEHKVLMRQAQCALNLGYGKELEELITLLGKHKLNDGYSKQLEQLQQQLKHLQIEGTGTQSNECQVTPDVNHKIVTNGETGRQMIATKHIRKGEMIFTERTSCIVPIPEHTERICHQCATAIMFSPTPCPECHFKVVYCSRKCRKQHWSVHRFECKACRMELLEMLGISHLALRMVLTYLPEWLLQLQLQDSAGSAATNGEMLWQQLLTLVTEENDLSVSESIRSLGMVSHLGKLDKQELMYYALSARLLQVYLRDYTDFYDTMGIDLKKNPDWQLVITAIILRNAGQLLVNGHVVDAFMPENDSLPLIYLYNWRDSNHLNRGCLRTVRPDLALSMNLPYLSLCNHACTPSIRSRVNGFQVSTYAMRDIAAGEEIFNCYSMDYKNSVRSERQAKLEQTYKFHCKCRMCQREQPDKDYHSFHVYICEVSQCRQIFVPNQSEMDWWLKKDPKVKVSCTVCHAPQKSTWYYSLDNLLKNYENLKDRLKMYSAFAELGSWLVDYHSLKLALATRLLASCFNARESFQDADYHHLERIIEWYLGGIAAQHGVHSNHYLEYQSYLLDLFACQKNVFQLNQDRLKQIRDSFDLLDDQTKRVFVNYYNEFIEQ